jgi:pyridoxal phosphate-dependent aminotransferase EpsN
MLASDDEALIEHARGLATQARDPGPYYRHSEIGFNYRLSNVCAAIGIAQLEVLDERVARRRQICEYYKQHLGRLPGIQFMPEADYGQPNYWLTVIQVDPGQFGATCEDIRLALEELDIESRRLWVPLHQQKPFAHCRCRGGAVAERLFATGLSLPSGSAMSEEDQLRVIRCLEAVHQRGGDRPSSSS